MESLKRKINERKRYSKSIFKSAKIDLINKDNDDLITIKNEFIEHNMIFFTDSELLNPDNWQIEKFTYTHTAAIDFTTIFKNEVFIGSGTVENNELESYSYLLDL